jgi:hypothetical protein
MNERFERAITQIDEENSRDPNHDLVSSTPVPRELLYSQRLTDWVLRLEPNASEALRLAARSQHIARWKIPRHTYPEGRTGYLKWRNDLKHFHATLAAGILRQAGYEESTIARVRSLNLKEGFPLDREAQILEDALCLVFLQYQFAELAAKLPPDKVVTALRKSWNKMSDQARAAALTLPFHPKEKALLEQALGSLPGTAQGIS